MKTRNGFVSNSSSASFVLKVEDSLEKVAQNLVVNINAFQKEDDFDIQSVLHRIEEKTLEWCDGFWVDHPTAKKEVRNLEKMKQFLEGCETIQTKHLLPIYLEVMHDIKVTEGEAWVLFEWETLLHQDFQESVPEILQDIILYYVLEDSRDPVPLKGHTTF
jgi:hypothetical protein